MKRPISKRLLALALSLVLLLGLAIPAGASNRPQRIPFEKVEGAPEPDRLGETAVSDSEDSEPVLADDEMVRVSILLESPSVLAAGFPSEEVSANTQAVAYRHSLEKQQDRLSDQIQRLAGCQLDVVWNLTLAANLISANVAYGDIEAIKAVPGVAEVVIENRYDPCATDTGETYNHPMMATSTLMSKAQTAWSNGYTGAGSRIAVIDTGIDLDHQSFSGEGLAYSLARNAEKAELSEEEYLAGLNLLTEEEVAQKLPELNISGVNAARLYCNLKVPFAYNYIDENYRVTHDYDEQGEHGSHVEGIAAANSFIRQRGGTYADALEAVEVKGVAPDAQLIVMKVFGVNGGAYDSDYMAAIEDAIVLGADSINLSLGSGNAGFSFNNTYQELLAGLQSAHPVVTISAGNSYDWAYRTPNRYLYIEDVNMATNGSPGSYTNALTVASVQSVSFNDDGTYTEPDAYEMSDFSSWGVPGSLELKPEITAPGGNIYSVNGAIGDGKNYESMDGTSMAAPQMAGMVALMAQFIRENDLEKQTGESARHLANSLLMSTALALKDSSGQYYPVLEQGSGMARVGEAVAAKSFIMMDEKATDSAADGKVKAELGEDAERKGVYTFSFALRDLTGEEKLYTLRTDLFTQDVRSSGYPADKYLNKTTTPLEAQFTYTVNGETYIPSVEEPTLACDLNNDGRTDAVDAQMILDAVAAGTTNELDKETADVSKDGAITSYDAHLILANVQTGTFVLPAGGEAKITVQAVLTEEQKTTLNENYPNGAYIEGFTFVEPIGGGNGEPCDVTHSVPILGFYGSWSDPSMFDVSGSAALYGDDRKPYLGDTENSDLVIRRAGDSSAYIQTGNPYLVEDEYPTGRAAMSSDDTLVQYKLSLIRNAAALQLRITNDKGKLLYASPLQTMVIGAYYYVNGGAWRNTDSSIGLGMTPASLGLKEGDTFTVSVTALPEYYAKGRVLTEEEFTKILDSDVLGKGATLSTTMTLDDTDPSIKGMTSEGEDVILTYGDNLYVAYVHVQNLATGAEEEFVPDQEEPGETLTVTLEGALKEDAGYLVTIADYAGHYATFKVGNADVGDGGTDTPVSTNGTFAYAYDGTWRTLAYADGKVSFGSKAGSSKLSINAAEYVSGYVIMAGSDGGLYIAKHGSWGVYHQLAAQTVDTDGNPVTIRDLAFSTKDNKLYALDDRNTIYTVDLESWELTKTIEILDLKTTRDDMSEEAKKLIGLAIDDEGTFYTVNNSGPSAEFATHTFKFTMENVTDGKIDVLQNWGSRIIGYTNYGGVMAWDHQNNALYFAVNYNQGTSTSLNEMFVINTSNGRGTSCSTADAVFGMYSTNSSTGLITSPTEATGLTLSPTEATLMTDGTLQITASVEPWNLEDNTVTWTSDNGSVATVKDGVVTAVSEGIATITATTAAMGKDSGKPLTATCTVTVTEPPVVALKGLVYDENSVTHWATFSTDNPAGWEAINGNESDYYYGGSLMDGLIYVHDGSAIYTIDPDTFEATYITGVGSTYIWNDSAPAEKIGDDYFGYLVTLSNDGTYLCLLDAPAGMVIYFDLSNTFAGDPMSSIALYGTETKDGLPGYKYYMITESGALYDVLIYAVEGENGVEYDNEIELIGQTGIDLTGTSAVSGGPSSSMLYDEESGYLILSAYTTGESAVVYGIHAGSGASAVLGSFPNGVWPVNSLYTYEQVTELTLRMRDEELTIYEGDVYQMKATVVPTSYTGGVNWSSSDESVVTVDESGRITALKPGSAEITATTVDVDANGQPISKTCHVEVLATLEVSIDTNGLIEWEDDSRAWVSLNTKDLSTCDVLHDSGARIIAGGAHDGKLYGFDGVPSLYWIIYVYYPLVIEPEFDYDVTAGGAILYSPSDFASMPAMEPVPYTPEEGETIQLPAGDIPVFVDADNEAIVILSDFEDGGVLGWEGLTDSGLSDVPVAIAFHEMVKYVDEEEQEHEAAAFYVLAADGTLYTFYVFTDGYVEDEDEEVGAYADYSLAISEPQDTGLRFADASMVTMTYIEDGVNTGLLVGYGGTCGELYYIDLSGDTLTSGKIGSIPDTHYIAALYTDADIKGVQEPESGDSDGQTALRVVRGNAAIPAQVLTADNRASASGMITMPLSLELEQPTDGSLNAIPTVSRVQSAEGSDSKEEEATVTLQVIEDVDVTNGLVRISYDPELLTFSNAASAAWCKAVVSEETGTVTVAYASGHEMKSGTALVTLTFVQKDAGLLDTSLTVATKERNKDSVNETVEVPVSVTLVGIEITAAPNKTEYLAGERFDPTGMEVTARYSDGTGIVVEDYTYAPNGPLYASNTEITVTYEGLTATQPITVRAPYVPPYTPPSPGHDEVDPGPEPGKVRNPFVDVKESAHYYDSVLWAVENGITKGTSATTFSPVDSCTRAEMVTFLWRAAGKPAPTTTNNPFVDVKPDSFYYEAVLWAVEKKITNGTSGTTFDPDDQVTRAQAVTFLWRFAGKPEAAASNVFTDVDTAAYYAGAVRWAYVNGITNGTSRTTFDPDNNVERGDAVTFLYRYFAE